MAVSTGDNITAAQFNSLQSRVANVMGTGSGDSGYGQTLSSAQVAVTDTVQATDMINIKTDIDKANNHQIGSDSSISAIAVGKVIGAVFLLLVGFLFFKKNKKEEPKESS